MTARAGAPEALRRFFEEHPRVALAFSGGCDSAYLLYAAIESGADVCAYYAHSAFQPRFELEDARRLCAELGAALRVLELDVLADENVRANPPERCYFCKRRIFSEILRAAEADGRNCAIDGTNASDDAQDRPGMRALREMRVYSPLRLCGITKAQVRALSREAGLFTWNKPAYACLATRVAVGAEHRRSDAGARGCGRGRAARDGAFGLSAAADGRRLPHGIDGGGLCAPARTARRNTGRAGERLSGDHGQSRARRGIEL